ncbi:glycine oxidase ThiO [Evansella clarkii]|uniref:glycine oxidase ThiO n=1 Tax=Evansella clarkii TaxID=79879 RepID=UPI000B449C73|nr:glycine oxidase ThiO [Evansella clarkii]
MKRNYEAIIVGGGIIGGSIAFHLANRGYDVLLLDKGRAGKKASSAAAGMLAAQAELNDCGPLFQLARKSRGMFGNLADELKEITGIDIELKNKGMYKIALNERESREYKRIIELQKRLGDQAEWLNQDELRSIEPALSEAVTGAMFIEKDGHVSAPALTEAFLKASAALGAGIKEYTEVQSLQFSCGKITGVVTDSGEFTSDHVIIAGGAWSSKVMAASGLKLDAYPVKGECFSVITERPLATGTIFSHGCYIVPKKGNRIVVGATVKPDTFNEKVTMDGILTLMEKARNIMPAITEGELESTWAGIRPQTGDGLPYLGEHPLYKGLYTATGHFRNGILLSPVTGEVIADLIEGKQPEIDLSPFLPARASVNRCAEAGRS